MSEEKRISVIIPIHNAEIYLSACIQSILDQTYTNFELLFTIPQIRVGFVKLF